MCITWPHICFTIHLLWCMIYIIIGSVQLVSGVFFLVPVPLLKLGSNICVGTWVGLFTRFLFFTNVLAEFRIYGMWRNLELKKKNKNSKRTFSSIDAGFHFVKIRRKGSELELKLKPNNLIYFPHAVKLKEIRRQFTNTVYMVGSRWTTKRGEEFDVTKTEKLSSLFRKLLRSVYRKVTPKIEKCNRYRGNPFSMLLC